MKKILIVEDEQPNRNLLQDILSSNGYQVVAAESGAAALEILREAESGFDLIVSDVRMPRMSGLELYDAVQREETLAVKPGFLFVTATPEPVAEHFAGQLAPKVVIKPFGLGTILAAVSVCLGPT